MAIYRGPGGPGDATTDATNEATVATNKAAEAAASATAAAASATSAASSATSATSSATSASTSSTNASTSATNAATSATNAATSETNAASSASAALSSQEDAETAETNASASATAAASSATSASTSATNASTSATSAATSATNAATSETNAAASYDSFDDRYLGAKASAPTTDNDGDALLTGALYWNSTTDDLFIWDGAAWNAAAFTASGAVTSFNTRTGAVTLSSGDVTTALGYTPSQVANLNDITDVTITSPSTNQILKYNGSAWVNGSDTDTGILYTDLSVSTAAAGSPALSYNNTNGVFTYTPPDLTSYITASSTDTLTNKSGNISQWTNDSNYLASSDIGSTVQAYDADTAKLDTTQTWTATQTYGDNVKQQFGASNDLEIYHNGTASYINDTGTGNLIIGSASSLVVQDPTFTTTSAVLTPTGSAKFTYNGATKLETSTTGISVTGTVATDRATGTVTTDNDLSFDLSATNNFSCTPTSGAALTFTNHTSGQSGYVLLDNSAGVAITAAATTKITATDLTTISTAGVYLVSYFDNGTNAYVTVSASYS